MKKTILLAVTFLLTLAMLAGCGATQGEQPGTTAATPGTTNPATPTTAEPTTPATAAPTTPTEDDTEYEGDASSYYIDQVYSQQIARYHAALTQQWDENAYLDNEMSALVVPYGGEAPLDNIGFTFVDLDKDGSWELIIGAAKDAEQDPLVFEIWTVKDNEPVMLAQSGTRNRYYLQYAQAEDRWTVAYEAENGAANHAVYYLQLVNGEFQVSQGVIFDAMANENEPWFMTNDLDWDVSNDTPTDEATADSLMEAQRALYTAQEYFPYSLYN